VFIPPKEPPSEPSGSPLRPDTSQIQSVKPIANAGGNKEAQEGEEVTLDGTDSAAADPAGEIVSYKWVPLEGEIRLIDDNTANPRFTAPSVSSDTELEFKLIVTDDKGRSSTSDPVTIYIKNNEPPVANAGPNQIVNESDTVTLDGTASKDPDLDTLEYSWKKIDKEGESPVTLDNANKSIATFTAPSNLESDSTLTFELTLNDGKEGGTASDRMQVLVKDSQPDAKDYLDKGNSLYELGMYEEAIEYYDRALAIDPNNVNALAYTGLSLLLGDNPNPAEAIEQFDKALAIDPNNVDTLAYKDLAVEKLEDTDIKEVVP